MSELHTYLSTINRLTQSEDGHSLAKLLQYPLGSQFHRMSKVIQRAKSLNVISYCDSNLSNGGVASAVAPVLLSLCAYADSNWSEAYQQELNAYNAILSFYKEDATNWLAPVLVQISNDLRVLASDVDIKLKKRDNETLRDALRNLTNGFTIVAKDRTPLTDPTTKKVALFAVTIVLFKIYFKLNTLQLCSKLINVVERPGPTSPMQCLTRFPVSDVVTYKFYLGRLKMFEDNYDEAQSCLVFALRHCPKTEMKNRQRILVNLIPVQMCLGIMPAPILASKYGFHDFVAMGQAVKCGDVKTFERIMQEREKSLIRVGIYLVLEQVKALAYRNLLKKIYLVTQSTRIKLSWVESALRWQGEDFDFDEIECIIANQIYQGRVKGYISHQNRTLIISKQNAFPTSAAIKSST